MRYNRCLLIPVDNISCYRVAFKFRDNPKLLENVTQVRKVLEQMSDIEFKNRYDVNEVNQQLNV